MNIENILLDYENKLSASEKYVLFSNEWKNIFPNHSGVYVIWEDEI